MNAIKALTAAFLLSTAAFASTAKGFETNEKIIPAPAFSWGSPEDLDPLETELLKNGPYRTLTAPKFNWGSADDLDEAALELLKVSADVSLRQPTFRWGTPEDLATENVQALRQKK